MTRVHKERLFSRHLPVIVISLVIHKCALVISRVLLAQCWRFASRVSRPTHIYCVFFVRSVLTLFTRPCHTMLPYHIVLCSLCATIFRNSKNACCLSARLFAKETLRDISTTSVLTHLQCIDKNARLRRAVFSLRYSRQVHCQHVRAIP